MYYILDDCKFWPDWTTDNSVSCPSVSKIYPYRLICNGVNGVSTFSPLFFFTCRLSGERSLPFGLLVFYFVKHDFVKHVPLLTCKL